VSRADRVHRRERQQPVPRGAILNSSTNIRYFNMSTIIGYVKINVSVIRSRETVLCA
jgi:hypothetical protein